MTRNGSITSRNIVSVLARLVMSFLYGKRADQSMMVRTQRRAACDRYHIHIFTINNMVDRYLKKREKIKGRPACLRQEAVILVTHAGYFQEIGEIGGIR